MAVNMKATVLWGVTPCSLIHYDFSKNLLYSLSVRGHPDPLKRRHEPTRLHWAILKTTKLLSLYLCENETVTQFIRWKNPCKVTITFDLKKNFRRVLNFVCILLDNSSGSEFCQRFGTLCLFHLHRRVGMKNEDGTDSVFRNVGIKIQTPGNYLEGTHSIRIA